MMPQSRSAEQIDEPAQAVESNFCMGAAGAPREPGVDMIRWCMLPAPMQAQGESSIASPSWVLPVHMVPAAMNHNQSTRPICPTNIASLSGPGACQQEQHGTCFQSTWFATPPRAGQPQAPSGVATASQSGYCACSSTFGSMTSQPLVLCPQPVFRQMMVGSTTPAQPSCSSGHDVGTAGPHAATAPPLLCCLSHKEQTATARGPCCGGAAGAPPYGCFHDARQTQQPQTFGGSREEVVEAEKDMTASEESEEDLPGTLVLGKYSDHGAEQLGKEELECRKWVSLEMGV